MSLDDVPVWVSRSGSSGKVRDGGRDGDTGGLVVWESESLSLSLSLAGW